MRRVALAVWAMTVVVARTASAESAADLFAEGRKLLDQNRPAEACAKLEQALALDPEKPGIVLNLGQCNAKQNKIATALGWFRRALSLAAERGMGEVENVAKAQIKALSPKVPTIQIMVAGTEHPNVTIDEIQVPPTSFSRYEIDAGSHTIVVNAPDRATATKTFVVDDKRDARQRIEVELLPEVSTSVEPPPAQPEPTEHWTVVDRGASRRHTGLIVGGIGTGLLLASGGVGLLARSKFDGTDDVDTRKTWKNVAHYGGTSLFVGGAAALAIGIGLYVSAPGKERVRQAIVVPLAGPDGAGLVLEGAF
jgi:hypothetical protein